MAERLDLEVAEAFPAPPSITDWRIDGLDLRRGDQRVTVYLKGTNGEERTFTFSGSDATLYINTLNKRNAGSKSNEKWTLEQLVGRGYLAGVVSGTPD